MNIVRIIAGISLLVLLPAFSSAGVRISLSNGRYIIADACRDSKGKLVCDVSGGIVEISRQDITSINEVTIQRQQDVSEPSEGSGSAADEKKTEGKPAPGAKGSEISEGGAKLPGGLTASQIKRLDEITERKTVLKPEREKLIKEREQLHEDVKNQAMIRTQAEFDSYKKRISDLEAKIIGFNDEVKKLNEEEKSIIDSASVK